MTISENINKSFREYMGSIIILIFLAGICGAVSMAFTFWAMPYAKIVIEIGEGMNTRIPNMPEMIRFFKFFAIFFGINMLDGVVAYMLSIGAFKCAMDNSRGRKMKISDLFFAFKTKPLKFLGLYIMEIILILLWGCLFIIPGIIKMISYSQAFYLMVENPDYGIMESIRESKILMNGHKEALFMLWVVTVIPIFILLMIPYVGTGLFTFLAVPVVNLMYINFYNDITLYKYDNNDESENEELL